MKIKRDKADIVFSKYIRTRDNWTCQRCGKRYPEGSQGLHCSHYHGRSKENTRFNDDNCSAICFGCHQYFTSHPLEHTEWKKIQLGEEEFDKLTLKANTYCKKDRKLAHLVAKEKLKEVLK
ncbi:MAG: recombination protein NinG [Nanoarchaeota archaeon]|nr:recombination protein NinG [Nanoarchaeota archaeon]